VSGQPLLYLSRADVTSLLPEPGLACRLVLEAFAALHGGRATSPPKQTVTLAAGHSFQCLISTSDHQGRAAAKWLGVAPVPAGVAREGIHATIMLNDLESGEPLAIMDGNAITGARTAAMSAAAAIHLARRDSRNLGFVGCGLQARHHLKALKAVMPGLTEVLAFSRSRSSTDAFVHEARDAGWRARATDRSADIVEQCDIIVTTVPMAAGLKPFLDPAALRPGAFVSAVDIARSWLPEGLRGLDIMATDDHAQQAAAPALAPDLGPAGSFDTDLGQLAAGAGRGRNHPDERAMFIFRGMGIADLALASAIHDAARHQGIGTRLER
jgi:alanine dehydrogenase